MARSIEEIKKSMLKSYAEDENIKEKYDIIDQEEFEFSKVSIENILFYIVAVAIWSLEVIFDRHQQEVKEYIDTMKPHSLRWYVNKAKEFRFGKSMQLTDYTDSYPDTDENGKSLTEKEIEELKIVKYAAANETTPDETGFGGGRIVLKIAKDKSNGGKEQLSEEQFTAFKEYINRVKDAGTMIEFVNLPADRLKMEITIYYDPMVLNEKGKTLGSSEEESPVSKALTNYISNLPFNGEYRNMELVDALQVVDGVEIVQLGRVEGKPANGTWKQINVNAIPESGYYELENTNITFTPYDSKNLS